MDIDWDINALDDGIRQAAENLGLVGAASAGRRAPWPSVRGVPVLPEGIWERVSALKADDQFANQRRRWAFVLFEHVQLRSVRDSFSRDWYERLCPVPEPEAGQYCCQQLLQRAITSHQNRFDWLGALARASGPPRESLSQWWDARGEFAERFNVDTDEVDGMGEPLVQFARDWLDRTDELLPGEPWHWDSWIEAGLARRASDGWPSHLNWRTVAALLGAEQWVGSVQVRLPAPPAVYGAASWLRAFRVFGESWADASLVRAKPFIGWRDPRQLAERTRGWLLVLLALNPEFMRRRQGLSRDRAREQRRILATSVLLALRWAALRVLLRAARPRSQSFSQEYAVLSERALGFPLPNDLSVVLPRMWTDGASRFLAPFLAIGRDSELTERFDLDWFWNPRCASELREVFPGENTAGYDAEPGSRSTSMLQMLEGALE